MASRPYKSSRAEYRREYRLRRKAADPNFLAKSAEYERGRRARTKAVAEAKEANVSISPSAIYHRNRRKAIAEGTWGQETKTPAVTVKGKISKPLSETDDAIYMRVWREKKRRGTVKVKSTPAEHQKAYRQRKAAAVQQLTEVELLATSEEELMAQVRERGKILTLMMRTPPCLWPAEWTEDL